MLAMPFVLRCWLPLLSGFALMFATMFTGPVLTWVFLMAGFGLILDAATAMWERAGSTGGLSSHKQ